jgi:hypothetical protein
VTDYASMTMIIFAWRRPYYLQRALDSWAAVPEVGELGRFIVALGESDRRDEQLKVIGQAEEAMGRPLIILPDSPAAARTPHMHRAMGEAAYYAWEDPATRFVALTEEDTVVSDDVLRYLAWAQQFEADPKVLCVCAHNESGTGWDPPVPMDFDADQAEVRRKLYFNSWCWGTWRDRWADVIGPSWDWDANTGSLGYDSGCDWNIRKRVMPGKYVAVVPEASRTQNIGKDEGVYAHPELFHRSLALSFRAKRGNVDYALVP